MTPLLLLLLASEPVLADILPPRTPLRRVDSETTPPDLPPYEPPTWPLGVAAGVLLVGGLVRVLRTR
jgi:hypothetical protein